MNNFQEYLKTKEKYDKNYSNLNILYEFYFFHNQI